jgi:orotate phosphoribosyltransferase-like protein
MTGWEICLQQLQVAQLTKKYDGILPHKQALAMKLRDEGKTAREIAEFFHVTQRAAEMLIERGERRYQAMMLLKEGFDTKAIASKLRITQNTAARLLTGTGGWNEATTED